MRSSTIGSPVIGPADNRASKIRDALDGRLCTPKGLFPRAVGWPVQVLPLPLRTRSSQLLADRARCLRSVESWLSLEPVSMGPSTLVARRASKKPVEEVGWSIVPTSFAGIETLNPSAILPFAANGAAAWFGGPSDAQLEALS